MSLTFTNAAQELTYQQVSDYLESSIFKDSMRRSATAPRFELLYNQSTLIEVDILSWEVNPWNDDDRAIVRAASPIAIGGVKHVDLTQFLLAENRKMLFGAFQLDEAGHIIFAHSILGGSSMDLQELQTCILSVAAIASSYEDILTARFVEQRVTAVAQQSSAIAA